MEGDFIGTDVTGTTAFDSNEKALGNDGDGVLIELGASANTIGATVFGSVNLISGNLGFGVEISGEGSSNNVVEGTFVGTDVTGSTAFGSDPMNRSLGNSDAGIEIDSRCQR